MPRKRKFMKQKVLSLRPTQFAVGMLEVDEKIKILSSYSKKKFRKYLRDSRVPVVLSPRGEMYVTDNHHFLSVCYNMGVSTVNIEVIEDFSRTKLNFAQFWRVMKKRKSLYPYCQFGEGPREPIYLPKDIRGLADDPYRSLAWFVRKSGGFENSEKNFAEFQWANFFRNKKLLKSSGSWGFARALVKASQLAQSAEAKHLPGFGKLRLKDKKVSRKKLKGTVSKFLKTK